MWEDYLCPGSGCPEKCERLLKERMEHGFEIFARRMKESSAKNMVVFGHYPTDYFWPYPEFMNGLRNKTRHVEYFGGHRHNVDQRSTTSIWPNNNWLVGGGGGWGCEAYGNEQGFVVGSILRNGSIATYPVLVPFEECCQPDP